MSNVEANTVLILSVLIAPICVGILGILIKQWFTGQKEGWTKYEEEREKWSDRVDASIQLLTLAIGRLEGTIYGKVETSTYVTDQAKRANDCKVVDLRLDEHGNQIARLEVKVVGIEKRIP